MQIGGSLHCMTVAIREEDASRGGTRDLIYSERKKSGVRLAEVWSKQAGRVMMLREHEAFNKKKKDRTPMQKSGHMHIFMRAQKYMRLSKACALPLAASPNQHSSYW